MLYWNKLVFILIQHFSFKKGIQNSDKQRNLSLYNLQFKLDGEMAFK